MVAIGGWVLLCLPPTCTTLAQSQTYHSGSDACSCLPVLLCGVLQAQQPLLPSGTTLKPYSSSCLCRTKAQRQLTVVGCVCCRSWTAAAPCCTWGSGWGRERGLCWPCRYCAQLLQSWGTWHPWKMCWQPSNYSGSKKRKICGVTWCVCTC